MVSGGGRQNELMNGKLIVQCLTHSLCSIKRDCCNNNNNNDNLSKGNKEILGSLF